MLKLKSVQKGLLITSFLAGIFVFLAITSGCNKTDDTIKKVETDSITDIDGNVYKTVKIGKQWWMAENLKVKKYRNGDSILFVGSKSGTNVFDSTRWRLSVNEGAFCILDSKDSLSANFNGKKYGFLYNAYTLSNPANIAPVGWHIPSDSEWKELETSLGMSNDEAEKVSWRGTFEGNKLKIQSGWYSPSDKYKIWGSNESGFSALGGSCKMFDGQDSNPGETYVGFWWTSSELAADQWYRYMDYNKAGVFRYFGPKTYGFSIRCVKDR
jgi:uncharacterized protein (TIGR02145 family)